MMDWGYVYLAVDPISPMPGCTVQYFQNLGLKYEQIGPGCAGT